MKNRWIPWPGDGQINISKIEPILHNKYFRRLSEKKQLAFAFLVFPGATHDRRQHSIGAYQRTHEFTARMVHARILTNKDAINLSLYALLHDIGHGPFSHVIEAVTKSNHKVNGLKVVDMMISDIVRCGGDVRVIKKYMRHEDPKYLIVSDKNFGMEKLDYLVRDQESIAFGPNIRRCVESVFNHLIFKNNKLMVDLKALDAAIEIQRAYIYFYRNVHLEKSAYIIQRFMQKLIYQLLNTSKESGGISEAELWEMTDGDLLSALRHSDNPIIKRGMIIFENGVRDFPKTSLSVRPKGYGWLERRAGKPIQVQEVDKLFFDKFFIHSRPKDLEHLEFEIAKILGVDTSMVAVSHIVEKNRFIPQNIWFYDGPKVYSLKKQDPEYFSLLSKELDKYLCVRVCVTREFREKLRSKEKEVMNLISHYIHYKS